MECSALKRGILLNPYASLFSNETKNVDPDGRGSEKKQGKIRETVNKIYCMNKIHFKKEKKTRFHKHTHNAIKKFCQPYAIWQFKAVF